MQTTSGFIQSNGVKIHYARSGGEKTPMVLCHGITDNGRCMLRLAEYLAPRFDVIMMDARGHGRSDAPEDGYTSDHHAEDLHQLILALELHNPIIYGHSMGARTTVRFAAKYPDVPIAIILEDPVYITPLSEEEMIAGKLWLEQLPVEIQYRKTLSEAERLEIAKEQSHRDWLESEQLEWARSKLQVSPNVVKVGGSMRYISDDFPKITCPVLILKADTDPEIRAKNTAAAAKIPHGKLYHVEGAGHNVRRDNWPATIQYLDQFLESLSP
jgi:pimeloyl-ACP methyl ester carboxylesterase